jgi:radical SAM superfamily enzyme YgiQ (UPF0313 family)
MPGKVLLISANRCTTPDPVFPLGLSFLNAALGQAGYTTRWLDLGADEQSLEAALANYRPDYVGVSLRNIDDVLIGKQTTYFDELSGICDTVRRVHSCPVILGGSGFTLFPKRLLVESGADFGVQGEGEACLVKLLRALDFGSGYDVIPGLVYRRGPEIVANAVQLVPAETSLTATDRPEGLISHYLETGGMLNVQTQRGCAHGCCYCTYPLIEGRVSRPRSPELVADEMEQLQARGARYVFIVDSVFNSAPEHVVTICEAMLRRNLQLNWGCFLQPQALTRELMILMSKAGLRHIEFGSDSFCDSVLEAYGKRFTFEDVRQASVLARDAGIDYCHFLICGGPGETRETLQRSFENARCLPGAIVMAVVGMRIYPGTHLWSRAVREQRLEPASDLLQPAYYVAPGLSTDELFASLRAVSRQSPNWIVGDPVPEYASLVQRLRRRGVVGPLWSYLALVQRIMPAVALSA